MFRSDTRRKMSSRRHFERERERERENKKKQRNREKETSSSHGATCRLLQERNLHLCKWDMLMRWLPATRWVITWSKKDSAVTHPRFFRDSRGCWGFPLTPNRKSRFSRDSPETGGCQGFLWNVENDEMGVSVSFFLVQIGIGPRPPRHPTRPPRRRDWKRKISLVTLIW